MSRPGLRSGSAGIASSEHEHQSEHEEVSLVNNRPPNPGPMAGFTAEEASSMHASVAAQTAVPQKAFMD